MDQLFPSTYYHIYNHANSDEDLFREPENYRYFLQQYHKHIDAIADTYCFCLMPNHFHLLVRIKPKELITAHLPGFENLEGVAAANLLSRQFSNFFNGYTKAFNKKFERRGSLFLKNFKRSAIVSRDYLASVIIYIHLNPVKHGFVKNPQDWKWSSYDRFLIDRLPLVKSLFTSDENYLNTYAEKIKSYEEYAQLENYFLQ